MHLNKVQLLPLERQAVIRLACISSLRLLGLFIILPVFALYAQAFPDITPLKVGLAMGIYGLTQALFQLPFGLLSDRYGRKPMILLGLLLFIGGSLWAALSTSLLGVIMGRALQGMGAFGSVLLAWVSDLTREEVRLRAMASVGLTIGLAFGVSFVLGPLLSDSFGVRGLFFFAALLGAFSLVVLAFFRGAPNPSSFPQSGSVTAQLTSLVIPAQAGIQVSSTQPPLRGHVLKAQIIPLLPIYFGVGVIHATLPALFLKIPLWVAALPEFSNSTSLFYLSVFVLSGCFVLPLIFYAERLGKIITFQRYSIAALILAEGIFLSFHETVYGLAFGLCLFFVGFNYLEASLPTQLSKQAGKENRGFVMGLFSTIQFLGLFLGGLLGGVFDALGGEVAVVLFCVILASLLLIWNCCQICEVKKYGKGT